MSDPPEVRRLEAQEAGAYLALRGRALKDEPLAFSASPGDDRLRTVQSVRDALAAGPDWALFGAFAGDLAGIAGLARFSRAKERHRALLWGMYVAPGHRGRGLGRALLNTAVRHASSLPGVDRVQLCVSEAAPAARSLYEAAGFLCWGREPDALRVEGRPVAVLHYTLDLRAPRPPQEPGSSDR